MQSPNKNPKIPPKLPRGSQWVYWTYLQSTDDMLHTVVWMDAALKGHTGKFPLSIEDDFP